MKQESIEKAKKALKFGDSLGIPSLLVLLMGLPGTGKSFVAIAWAIFESSLRPFRKARRCNTI
jgi:hypothetical protein